MAFQHLKSCLFSCERAFVFLRIELTCILQQSAANEYSCLPLVEADNPAKVLYSQDFFRQREPSALSTSCVSLDTSLLCSAGVQELVIFSFNFDFFNKFGRVASYNCHRRYIFGYHAAGSDNCTVTDTHSREYSRIDTNPCFVLDDNRTTIGGTAIFRIRIVINRNQIDKSEAQAVLGRQYSFATPRLTERHGYDPTCDFPDSDRD